MGLVQSPKHVDDQVQVHWNFNQIGSGRLVGSDSDPDPDSSSGSSSSSILFSPHISNPLRPSNQ